MHVYIMVKCLVTLSLQELKYCTIIELNYHSFIARYLSPVLPCLYIYTIIQIAIINFPAYL